MSRLAARTDWTASAAALLLMMAMLACATPAPVPVAPGSTPELAANEGFVILAVDTDVQIEDLRLGKFSVATDLEPNPHIWLVKMKAGRYRWTTVRLVAQRNDDKSVHPESINVLNKREFDFEVEPGCINYPGELIVRLNLPQYGIDMGVSVRNRNHSAMAVRRLAKTDRALLAKYPLRYAGMSGDGFLEFYSTNRDRVGSSRKAAGAGTAVNQ